jgi:hypothetical protein
MLVEPSPVPAKSKLGTVAMWAPQSALSPQLVRIDVLVAYTPAAAAATGDINGLIQLAFDESNRSYANSGIALTLGPAFVGQVDYSEAGRTYAQHVAALQSPSDGIMDVVHTWRDQYSADVVALIVNDASYCGLASVILAGATNAFVAVHYDCATGYYSFGHEIGHLQGARHDRAVDPNSTNGTQSVHGYVEPNLTWRTIMAYPDACGSCLRVQYWSNPNVTYPPTGQPMGTTTYEFDAQELDADKFGMGVFRTSFPVSIAGAARMAPGNTCTFTASVSGGTAPYSYTWSWQTTLGASAVGYSPSNGTFILVAESSATYTIYLTVIATDSNGEEGTSTKAVAVSQMNNGCSY